MVNDKLKTSHLTIILLAGTIVRFIYGYTTKSWLASPDQLAWGLSIDEMINSRSFSYLQFIHYPHEGGSFLIGLLSLIFRPFENIIPSLSWTALAIDVVSRLIQIKVANKVFGKSTAIWFGIWTIFSIPLLLPWTVVNFGMHSLSSFFPFILLYIVFVYRESRHLAILCAVFSGIAFSYSYDNLALIIISLLYITAGNNFAGDRARSVANFIVALIITILPHLCTRLFIDTGFGLETNPVASIRGVPLDNFLTPTSITNFRDVWYKTLPGSFLLNCPTLFGPEILKYIVSAFLISGLYLFLRTKTISKQIKFISASSIVIFFILYSFSPFYTIYYNHKGYVFYRHLSYIVPLLALLVITGFVQSGKIKNYLLTGWIILCCIASIDYIRLTKKTEQPLYKAAGWVTARKYGHDIEKAFQIRAVTRDEFRDEFTVGLGWGLSATILENKKDSSHLLKLIAIVESCPPEHIEKVIEGVTFSFSDKVTPVLDPKFKSDFDKIVSTRNFPVK